MRPARGAQPPPDPAARPLAGARPAAIADGQGQVPAWGICIVPYTPAVARDYILDRRDRDRRVPPPPPAFEFQRGNAAWGLWVRC
jgi:hypothetical protein